MFLCIIIIHKLQASRIYFNSNTHGIWKSLPACDFVWRADKLIQPVASCALTAAPQRLDFSQDNAGPSRFSFQGRGHPNCIRACGFLYEIYKDISRDFSR